MTPAQHAAQRSALTHRVEREFLAAWGGVDRSAIRASWAVQAARLLAYLTTAQAVAAGSADTYVTAAVSGASDWEVVPAAFAQSASDGRPLASLLQQPALSTLSALSRGVPVQQAMALGRGTAMMIGHTQTADAGRVADLTAAVANTQVRSWTRMLVGKTCARCLILAGRRYSWKADFKRHPRCDCIAVPSTEAISTAPEVNPRRAFRAMSTAEQDRVFGKAGAEAIRSGADIGQVVNARSGMVQAGGRLYTTVNARKRPRLMPEQIFREANGNRTETIRLLSLHGYIRPRAQGV